MFEGLWIYSVSGIPRQNENKNKMVHMGIEPGSRDSQANALTVTSRVFTVFRPSHCLIAQLSNTCFLRVANHWIKHNWFDLLVQPSTQTWAISLYAMFLYIYHQRVYSLWQTKLTTIWRRSQSVKYNACRSKFHGFLVQTDPGNIKEIVRNTPAVWR